MSSHTTLTYSTVLFSMSPLQSRKDSCHWDLKKRKQTEENKQTDIYMIMCPLWQPDKETRLNIIFIIATTFSALGQLKNWTGDGREREDETAKGCRVESSSGPLQWGHSRRPWGSISTNWATRAPSKLHFFPKVQKRVSTKKTDQCAILINHSKSQTCNVNF